MKNLLFIWATSISMFSYGQKKVETEIKAENVFELSIVDIFPEKYPTVSVIFQAKNKEGKPLWLLKKSEIRIQENGIDCNILDLINITTNKPLNIALVFDHSGSMVDDPQQMPKGMETMQDFYFYGLGLPDGYIMPIDYAKMGVYGFINSSHGEEDSVVFIGFSDEVDQISPLTNDLSLIKPFIDASVPDGATALYDGLYTAIEQLKNKESQPAIVAITDGQDNSSKNSAYEIIQLAKEHDIPIYIIGLGGVDTVSLENMASATNGLFYHTNDANQIEGIYRNIKEQLRSIYQVDYNSLCDDFKSSDRTIQFSFLNDTLTFSNATQKYTLPEEAIAYLEKKEDERLALIEMKEQESLNEKLLWGSIGLGVLLLGVGSFIVIRRRSVKINIESIYPNPFAENVTIEYEVSDTIDAPQLHIIDLRGKEVTSLQLDSNATEITIDSSQWGYGVYLFKITGGGKKSETLKGVKR